MSRELHARTFDVGGRQVLAYLDTDDNEILFICFRLWGGGSVGPVEFSIKLPDGAGQKAIDLWEPMQLQILFDLTPERCLATLEKAGVLNMLENLGGHR